MKRNFIQSIICFYTRSENSVQRRHEYTTFVPGPSTHPLHLCMSPLLLNMWRSGIWFKEFILLVLENCRGHITVCKLENLEASSSPKPQWHRQAHLAPFCLCLHPHPPEATHYGLVTHDLASNGTDYTLDNRKNSQTCFTESFFKRYSELNFVKSGWFNGSY